MKNPKRPKDSNSRAVLIAKIATGEIIEANPDEGKNAAAVSLGKLGGKARAKSLNAKKRKAIAKKAAKKRWDKD
ncbi:MAG TPA: RNA-binding protein [Bacteroidia bacterium]|jgi:hypothetical protein|nr:RNA-binding protein [Bacteroidia bacterium]